MTMRIGSLSSYCCLLLVLTTVVNAAAKPSKDSKDTAAIVGSTKSKGEFPEEDSDMLMEPNDFAAITVLRSQEHPYHALPSAGFRPIAGSQVASARMDDGVSDSHSQAAQNFYPPFFREAPPLGHSRPYFSSSDGPVLAKYAIPLTKVSPTAGPTQRNFDATLLGSGDFGVIRGGTFYPEEEMDYHPDYKISRDFYGDANNGHASPSDEDFIEKYTYPEEQFAQFRDFADINTPADGAFSQFVVVYAAKNATKSSGHPHPKNIFEQLQILDREKDLEVKKAQPSKAKAKLARTKLQRKYKKDTNTKDVDYDPLLALS